MTLTYKLKVYYWKMYLHTKKLLYDSQIPVKIYTHTPLHCSVQVVNYVMGATHSILCYYLLLAPCLH